jgi:hypothetical protein
VPVTRASGTDTIEKATPAVSRPAATRIVRAPERLAVPG